MECHPAPPGSQRVKLYVRHSKTVWQPAHFTRSDPLPVGSRSFCPHVGQATMS